MNDLDTLNELSPGWTGIANGLICNPDHIAGGIIDKTILTGKWFVIFNDDRNTLEGFASRAEAVQAFIKAAE
jgi:hypothetical protein